MEIIENNVVFYSNIFRYQVAKLKSSPAYNEQYGMHQDNHWAHWYIPLLQLQNQEFLGPHQAQHGFSMESQIYACFQPATSYSS